MIVFNTENTFKHKEKYVQNYKKIAYFAIINSEQLKFTYKIEKWLNTSAILWTCINWFMLLKEHKITLIKNESSALVFPNSEQ